MSIEVQKYRSIVRNMRMISPRDEREERREQSREEREGTQRRPNKIRVERRKEK